MTRLFEYTVSKRTSQKGAKEELYGTPTKLLMGIQVADGAIAGKGRTESVPDQPGSSCDAQLVVRLVAALSGARGSSFCAYIGLPKSSRSGSTAECARTHCPLGAIVWTTGPRTGSAAIGGGCLKKSLASASIQQRHALIERVREQMSACSVRKLCRLLQVSSETSSCGKPSRNFVKSLLVMAIVV